MKSKEQTHICKLCFKEIPNNSIYTFFKKNYIVCDECIKKLKPKFIKFEFYSVKCLAIYDYDDYLKQLIYQYKGCYDIELKDVFLFRFIEELKLRYKNYKIIPIPSTKEADELRGFNHVYEIAKSFNLEIINCLTKIADYKQANLNEINRKNNKSMLSIVKNNQIENSNILILDDIFTSGSTLKCAINLIKQFHPKKIKALLICKTPFKDVSLN